MNANINPLGLLATLIFLYACIDLTINGDIAIACGAYFIAFCSLLQEKAVSVIFLFFYVVLFIKIWRETKVNYLILGVSMSFMYENK